MSSVWFATVAVTVLFLNLNNVLSLNGKNYRLAIQYRK